MTDLKKCKIIDTINVTQPRTLIQTPCRKFLIGIAGHSIFRYCLKTKQKFRIAGSITEEGHQDGTRDESLFNSPQSLTLTKDLKTLFVSDTWNRVIRAICIKTGITTTLAGQVGQEFYVDGPKEKACFKQPRSLKLSPDGNNLYVSDWDILRAINITTGQVDTIATFENFIQNFILSPDNKYIIISNWIQILKYNIESCKFEIIIERDGFFGCEISKDGQFLFVLNTVEIYIKVVNLATNQVIDTITTPLEPYDLLISANGKKLFVYSYYYDKINIINISKYYTNFKTFLQSQIFKHSFLPRQVSKRFN